VVVGANQWWSGPTSANRQGQKTVNDKQHHIDNHLWVDIILYKQLTLHDNSFPWTAFTPISRTSNNALNLYTIIFNIPLSKCPPSHEVKKFIGLQCSIFDINSLIFVIYQNIHSWSIPYHLHPTLRLRLYTVWGYRRRNSIISDEMSMPCLTDKTNVKRRTKPMLREGAACSFQVFYNTPPCSLSLAFFNFSKSISITEVSYPAFLPPIQPCPRSAGLSFWGECSAPTIALVWQRAVHHWIFASHSSSDFQ
jgi:hypothetical protein